MRLSALRSLFDCRGRVYFCAWSWVELGHDMSRERFLISSLADLIRQSMRTSACSIGRFVSLHLGMDHRVKPGGDEKRGNDPEGARREGGQGDRSPKPPQFPSPVRRLAMARPGRKRVAGTTAARAPPLLHSVAEQRSRIRPSNKCPASGICMTWSRRQAQNVHRPCLHVYTRTAISRMRRSPRVQRGRAIFCSIAAGANCRSVACARSAH